MYLRIYLKSSKAYKENSKYSMSVIFNTLGVTADFEANTKSSNANYVGRGLTRHMKIKPSRVS